MKFLQAVTCLAVLATIGYYFWGEYRTHVARQAAYQAKAEAAVTAAMRDAATELAATGRCTALAKAITDARGELSPSDLSHARLCYTYASLTAFERNSFDLYADALMASP